MQTGEFDFYYAPNKLDIPVHYNDNFKSIIQLAIDRDLIIQGGAWFYLNKGTEDEMKFQGKDKLIEFLRDNPELVTDMRDLMLDLDVKTE